MNDKLLMDNYLLILKSTVEVFVHGTLEASNSNIRNTLKMGLDTIICSQANTYDEMTKYNWYTINNIKEKDIKDTLKKICNN